MAGEHLTARDNADVRSSHVERPMLTEQNGLGSLALSDVRRLTSSNVTSNLHGLTIEGTESGGTETVSGSRFADAAGDLFRQLDRDENGHLNRSELGAAIGNPNFTGERAQVVGALQRHQNAISQLNPEFTLSQGITRADLSRFGEIASAPAAFSNGRIVGSVESTMGAVRRSSQRSAEDMQLYRGPVAIRPDAIRNGNGGPGTFESTLSALAENNPEAIRQMIRQNANGTFTVTFPGDREHPITVSRPTEAELGLYRASTNGGIWPDVIAKAYGEYALHHNKVLVDSTRQEAIRVEPAMAQRDIMRLLTGDNVQRSGMFDNLSDDLTSAFRENRAVVARRATALIDFSTQTPAGLQNDHTYAVVGWDPRGADGGTVTLSDPSTRDSSHIRLSLQTFRSNFNQIDFEGPTAPQPARAPRLPERAPGVYARQRAGLQ